MSQQSPIFVKTEAFMLWLFQHTNKFPRDERFRLAKRIDDAIFAFHENLIYAAKTSETRQYLQLADAELDKLRTYLRFAVELNYTSPKQFQYSAEQTTEIGKLLGGWVKIMRA